MIFLYILLALLVIHQAYSFGKYVGMKTAEESEKMPEVYIFEAEMLKDTWYAYTTQNKFIGQASTIEAVTELVREKKPGHKYYIAVCKS